MNLPANRQHTIRGLSPGTQLGRYTVVRRVGSGGMAELYLARLDGPEGFVKPVALKLMHPHLSDDEHFAQMFLKEARIAATLEHQAIVPVLDVGEYGGEYFMALEFVHGKDLRRLLADVNGPVPLGASLWVVQEVARALHYAHGLRDPSGRPLGIVHRDVSPSNVLLSFRGGVKLADFGVAKMTERTNATATGALKGKLGYMSPEQCLQEQVDARSDVFSLGVVLYELTTGRRAFRADQPVTVMNRVIDGDWVSPKRYVPDYPPGLLAVLTRALASEADDRYPSAEALCEALGVFAEVSGIEAGAGVLAEFLSQQYGQPAMPDLTVPTVEKPTLHTVPIEEHRTVPLPVPQPVAGTLGGGTRRWATAIALVAFLGVGGVVGWQAARTTGAESRSAGAIEPASGEAIVGSPVPDELVILPASDPSVASGSGSTPAKARSPEPLGSPAPTGALSPTGASSPIGSSSPTGSPDAEVASTGEPEGSADRPAPRRARSRRRSRKSTRKKKSAGGFEALLPPSAR